MPPLLTRTHHYLLPPPTLHRRHNHHIKPLITSSSNHHRFHFTPNRIVLTSSKRILFSHPIKSASINEVSVHNNPEASNEFLSKIRKWVSFIPSIFPGGTWWNFSDDDNVQLYGQPVTVWYALGKMWNLVAKDRWVIFAAFSALIIAAVRYNS
jgi:ATP-binding cassette subfamily B (MDR/TAP) protein 9